MAGDESKNGPGTAVAAYKAILQRVLDNRPSGTRLKLAAVLGKNRSFVSQITNPIYPVPIPARHVDLILEVCHLSPAERGQFLEAYAAAHPARRGALSRPQADAHPHSRGAGFRGRASATAPMISC